MSSEFSRQHDLFNADLAGSLKVCIIGVGHVGSAAAYMLVKAGVGCGKEPLVLVDGDEVGEENLNTQFYRPCDIGKAKVDALSEHLDDIAPNGQFKCYVHSVKASDDNIDAIIENAQIVICAVDDMDARKGIFNACKRSMTCKLFIDTRTGGFAITQYALDPRKHLDCELFDLTWVPKDKVEPVPCTGKGISWTVFMTAAMIGETIWASLNGREYANRRIHDASNPGDPDRLGTSPELVARYRVKAKTEVKSAGIACEAISGEEI